MCINTVWPDLIMSVYIQAKNMVLSPNACIYFSVYVYSLAEVDICTWGDLVSWLNAKSLACKLPPERESDVIYPKGNNSKLCLKIKMTYRKLVFCELNSRPTIIIETVLEAHRTILSFPYQTLY
jgi:hypothetical protein